MKLNLCLIDEDYCDPDTRTPMACSEAVWDIYDECPSRMVLEIHDHDFEGARRAEVCVPIGEVYSYVIIPGVSSYGILRSLAGALRKAFPELALHPGTLYFKFEEVK